jgi:hypothetical protein
MARFDDFLNGVIDGVPALAKETLGNVPAEALNDAREFLTYATDNLREWTEQLASGGLAADEFADLANDLLDLGKLAALSRLGIAKTALQRFRDGLVELITSAATKAFVP